MSNKYPLINCEGDILVIFFEKNNITAQALLDDGTGKILFDINKSSIIKYLNNEIKLKNLLEKSLSKTVEFYDFNSKLSSKINKKDVGKLSCEEDYYINLPLEMILPFEKRIELAVKVNYIALDFKKIMDLVKHYYYLKEKTQLLYLTFGDNNPIKKKCEKQLNDLKNYFIDMEIPFEFVSEHEIPRLNINKVCLINEFGIDIIKLLKKDINKITNKEMNILVYNLSDLIADLNKTPRFWNKKAKSKYIQEYKDHYYPIKRNIVINDILK